MILFPKVAMLTNRTIILKTILLCCMFGMACSGPEKGAPLAFDEDYLNKQISLTAEEFFNTYKTGDAIYLTLRNNSTYEIIFPNDYNIRIFSWRSNEWEEMLEIPATRLPQGNFTLSPKINSATGKNLFVVPALPDHTQRYELRIYVFGEAKKDDLVLKVGAYADVALSP